MVLVVAKDGKTYYIREINNTGISIKKNKAKQFMVCLDDRPEPIAIYNNWESANESMEKIIKAIEKDEKFAIVKPND